MDKKLNAKDLDPAVYALFDDYVHNAIGRREFLKRLSKYTVAGMSAGAIFEFLAPNYALAEQVKKDDPRLQSEYVEYESSKDKEGGGKIRGLLARPAKHDKKLPGVLVVHENRGLNPYIEDVARRAAVEDFIALAPDALTPLGGYPGNDDEGRKLQATRDRNEMLEDFIAGYQYLKAHPACSGKVGVVGFCFGGWISNMMAVRVPELAAAVPFYGGQAPVEDVPKINAPLLLHFAETDPRVNEGWPAYEAALKKHDKQYKAHIYAGTNHGFHNDTTPRYDEEAAKLAWKRTIDFFNKHLS
ncbi:MAG TPA: dienelactone hydrolase family protein [Gammaproteobacteria bacterium]